MVETNEGSEVRTKTRNRFETYRMTKGGRGKRGGGKRGSRKGGRKNNQRETKRAKEQKTSTQRRGQRRKHDKKRGTKGQNNRWQSEGKDASQHLDPWSCAPFCFSSSSLSSFSILPCAACEGLHAATYPGSLSTATRSASCAHQSA